jgi:Xaa-Pro aminopeptidase
MQTEDRIKKLQDRMAENKVDIAAIGPTSNMRYLLGFSPYADERLCVLLVSPDQAFMVVPGLNAEEVAAHTTVNLIPWKDADGPLGALKQAKANLGRPGKLAVDNAMRADSLLHLLTELAPGQAVPADDLVSPLRLIKTADEIATLADSAALADKAMQAAVDHCSPGATEKEVAWAAESTFVINGAEEVCFTLVASGPNGAHPHHRSQDRRLQKGDTIIIDIGASYRGYKSDITRVVHLGEPDAEVLKVYNAVKKANETAMARVKPGVKAEAIDAAARSFLEEAGYGEAFIHRTGHGIGLDVHESPWIMAGNQTTLAPGMAFSIEPGVYLPGKFGVRVEDIVVVTDTGVRNLTGFDNSLVIKD